MTDDEVVALLNDHRRDGALPGRARIDRGQVIDEIGERPTDVVDAWVESHGGAVVVLGIADEVYELPSGALADLDPVAPPSPDEPRNSL